MNDKKRLLVNVIIVAIIAVGAYAVYLYFSSRHNTKLKIDDTSIQIRSIKTIAEISTVSYRDEIAVDSVEYYTGNYNYTSPSDWKEIYDRTVRGNVKRRLTLIVKGEVRYGLDLTDGNFTIHQNKDTVWLKLPKPEILDILLSPSKTEIFQEQGKWSDSARKEMENQAKYELRQNAEDLKLHEKAQENAERLFRKLVLTKKEIIIDFE